MNINGRLHVIHINMQSVNFSDVYFYAYLLTLFLLQVVECNKMIKKLIKI